MPNMVLRNETEDKMLFRCRKCRYSVEAEKEPESCPACGRMFYDVFTSYGIATYGIMENLTARDKSTENISPEAESFAAVSAKVRVVPPIHSVGPLPGSDTDGDCGKCLWYGSCAAFSMPKVDLFRGFDKRPRR